MCGWLVVVCLWFGSVACVCPRCVCVTQLSAGISDLCYRYVIVLECCGVDRLPHELDRNRRQRWARRAWGWVD